MIPSVEARRHDIAALCRRFYVRRLDLFGSAARATDFRPDCSDIDLVVEYAPAHPPALAGFFALRDALTALLGRPVDLVMASSLRNPFLRTAIERSRETLYGA